MPSRSPSPRDRGRTRSRTPLSDAYSASPRRSVSPRSRSRSRNGRSITRSRSPPVASTKIVVERLTKNVREEHLKEIFGVYGSIRDMDMPMNRQSDAEAAIAHMHEAQIDGAMINVSIVLPRRKFSPSPPLARRGANIDPRVPLSRGGGPPPPRRRSPPRGYGRPSNLDTYRPRSVSRSRSPPRRNRSRSYSSRSRSPPRRRGGRRDSPGRNGTRRRSPSYSSYSSRSRSRSRDRGYRVRR